MINKKGGITLSVILVAFVTVLVISRPWALHTELKQAPVVQERETTKQAIPAAYASRFLRLQPVQVAILGLSTEQLKIAQTVYDNNVCARLTLEAELATSKKVNDRESIIDIPSYSKRRTWRPISMETCSLTLGKRQPLR